ncbi:MAG: MBL fold metallo-hydrolase, partial [Rhodothermales bacterium]|nr:MBL fold metallo-hydrolase [Rhodothermales bacterium]
RVQGFSESIRGRLEAGEAEMAPFAAGGSPKELLVLRHLRRYYEDDLDIIAHEYEQIKLTPPNTTFNDSLTLFRAERRIQLLDLGPGKSGAATVVYLPDDGVVITGDVVTRPIPYGFARDPVGWLKTLRRISALEFRILIPGHGEIDHGKGYVGSVIDLVDFMLTKVQEAVAASLDVETTREALDLGTFRDRFTSRDPLFEYRFDTWFAQPAIERAHRALSPE